MKIVFAGTPQFAAIALKALLQREHEIVGVYTQPDRPSGRGLKLNINPVKSFALQHGLPIFQPSTLRDDQTLATLDADVMVVAAYGLLLPSAILATPRFGCINIHPSLLPRWRGAAPIPRTIEAGDKITGVTIMRMDVGLDTGPILLQRPYVLDDNETSASLHDQLACLGAEALLETLSLLSQDPLPGRPQDNALATYAAKITKDEALINWNLSAHDIALTIRAFNPWPVSYTSWRNQSLRVWQAQALSDTTNYPPRTLIHADAKGIDIATGNGILRLLTLQLPGGKPLNARDFFNAHQHKLEPGGLFI